MTEEFLAKIRATPQEKLLLILRKRGIFVGPETPKDEIARLLNYQLSFAEARNWKDELSEPCQADHRQPVRQTKDGPMKTYRVEFNIDVSAANPEAACLRAWQLLTKPGALLPIGEVIEHGGDGWPEQVDLEIVGVKVRRENPHLKTK